MSKKTIKDLQFLITENFGKEKWDETLKNAHEHWDRQMTYVVMGYGESLHKTLSECIRYWAIETWKVLYSNPRGEIAKNCFTCNNNPIGEKCVYDYCADCWEMIK